MTPLGQILRSVAAGLVVDDSLTDTQPLLPDCGTCLGRRYLRRDVPLQHALFGSLVPCPACNADSEERARARRIEELYATASLEPLSPEQRRKTFAAWQRVPAADAAFRAAWEWSVNPEGWLVISGESGSGKTHVCLAAVNRLIQVDLRPVRWFYVNDLVGYARSLVPKGEDYAWRKQMQGCPLLALDDLGALSLTDWAVKEFLEPVLDARYRDRLPTLITLIGTPEQVKQGMSESIGRRMRDVRVSRHVHNDAPEWGLP